MPEKKHTGSLPLGTLLGYGIGSIGEGIGYNFFFSFFSFFLTTQAGIAPAIAGVISGIAVLWDAVTDPIVGSWSDHTRNPKGRRRPFIMTGSILFGISIALLFLNLPIGGTAKVIYYIIVNMFYWLAMTSCVIPHISLGSELTEDFNERTKLRTYATALMGFGTLIAVGTPLLLVGFYEKIAGSASAGWALAGITYGITVAFVYQLCAFLLRGKEPENPNAARPAARGETVKTLSAFFKNAIGAFRNRPLAKLLWITFFVNIVVTLGSGLVIYLLTYVYEFNEAQSSLVYTLQGILVIVAAVVIGAAAQKIGKKTAMAAGIILYILSHLVILLLPIGWPALIVCVVLFALGNSGYWTMIYAMSYDASIIEQLRSGERPDGLYTSLIGLLMKFGNALGSVITGVGLQLVGFSETAAVQSEAAVKGIRVLYALAPSAVLAIALIFALLYPLTRQRYEKLSAALEEKNETGSYDPKVLEGL